MNRWFESSYARLLIDNHITEDDPSFLRRFDPGAYVRSVQTAGVDAAMVYACCHNGNCYYPTKVGHPHANLDGRDLFGEVVDGLNRAGIAPIAYYTAIYHNRSAKEHPAWRQVNPVGRQRNNRYWFSCPNNADYRAFVKAQLAEIAAYPVRGIFIDMTFWPDLCLCPACREGYRARGEGEIPETVDWRDPRWMSFQRFREESLAAYAAELTAAVRAANPALSVTHQSSPFIVGWRYGQRGLAPACDYLSGDFYGGRLEHQLGVRAFAAGSAGRPIEFMTSRCHHLRDHTSSKSEEKMRAEAATTLAVGGAYFFIDAINPDGTLEPAVYETFGRISATLAPFTAEVRRLRPELWADTGVYFSLASLFNDGDNGRAIRDIGGAELGPPPVLQQYLGAVRALGTAHLPFRVVAENRPDLDGLRHLVCINPQCLSDAEADRIRAFVRAGGTLVATGLVGIQHPDGRARAGFALADVLGVAFDGSYSPPVHYLAFPDGRFVSCRAPAPLVRAAGAAVRARINVPLFPPGDAERFASIHSNPPGRDTEFVGLSEHAYGRGRAFYLASPVLAEYAQEAQGRFAMELFRSAAPSALLPETDAPAAVEVCLARGAGGAVLVSLVNWQADLPNVPARDIAVAVALPGGARPAGCVRISDGRPLPFAFAGGVLRATVPVVETLEMVRIDLHEGKRP